MAINQISTSNTFGQWITASQTVIALANTLTDGKGATFVANTILEISGSGSFLNVANVAKISTILFYDGTRLTSNASLVAGFDKANSANVLAQAAYDKANSANVLAQAAYDKANGAYDQANTDITSLTVTSGTFGNASIIPVVTVLANGRVSSISNTAANLTQITAGTLNYFSGNIGIGTTVPTATLDVAGTFNTSKAHIKDQTLIISASAVTWDTSVAQVATLTLTESITMNAPTNLKIGNYVLKVVQGSGGANTINWNSAFKWPLGIAPTLSTGGANTDIFSFFSDGTNMYGSMLKGMA